MVAFIAAFLVLASFYMPCNSYTCLAPCNTSQPLLIGAFNVRIFGKTKMSKPDVVQILIQIVLRYDIIMMQEIRDKSQSAFSELVERVNNYSSEHYNFVISPRTGRGNIKEQYGFIYRTSKVAITSGYQHHDCSDVFEREPYVVEFARITEGCQKRFFYIALHSRPYDALAEINELVDVYDYVRTVYGENGLIAGDFNADCRYICKSCFEALDMWRDSRFTWLIDSQVDTTVGNTDCAYDRLVVAGRQMTTNSKQAGIFRFDLAYSLSTAQTLTVSDHYPVEFSLC